MIIPQKHHTMEMTTHMHEALRRDAIDAFRRATASRQQHEPSRDIVAAIDASNHVVLEVLAHGAGGKKLYDDLHISRFVSIDTTANDAHALRKQVGLSGASSWPAHTIVLIVPPSLTTVQLIATALAPFLHHDPSGIHCAILWLPAATPECNLEMERQGLAGVVEQRNLSLGLLPVDRDVATLCQEKVLADLYVHGQHHALTQVVRSILAVETHSRNGASQGRIQQVTCHGVFATQVHKMLNMAHDLQRDTSTATPSRFERLVLIDRMEDPLSMLLTPMTYEGLLDALVGMNHGVVTFDRSISTELQEDCQSSESSGRVKVIMNYLDDLFEEIRDVNINTLISYRLADIAQRLVTEVRPTTRSQETTSLAQITALLKKMPHLVKQKRSLANHLTLVEQIQQRSQNLGLQTCVETEMAILSSGMKKGITLPSNSIAKDVDKALEEAILRDEPHLLDAYDVLKLLCLLSLVSGGLKEDRLAWYRHQLCHSYGYHLAPLFARLERLELLSSKNKFDYQRRRRELSLMREVMHEDDANAPGSQEGGKPRDIHFMFPYTGYCPMSVRLVQTSLGMKVKMSLDISSLVSTSSASSMTSTRSHEVDEAYALFGGDGVGESQRRHILVYYIGGVTVAELAAYRYLNNTQSEFHFFVATTAICNGTRLLRGIV